MKEGDAKAMQEYMNTLSSEQTYIRMQGKQLTLEEEESWLKTVLEKREKQKAVHLLVFTKQELIGIADIIMEEEPTAHVGNFVDHIYMYKVIG